jgi:hypothetical protein
VLYKLIDKHHYSWGAQKGLHLGRSKGERPKVRVFTRTGW